MTLEQKLVALRAWWTFLNAAQRWETAHWYDSLNVWPRGELACLAYEEWLGGWGFNMRLCEKTRRALFSLDQSASAEGEDP